MKKIMLKKIFLSVLFLHVSAMSLSAFGEETEGIIAREKFSNEVMHMLNNIKFKELAELAEDIRRTESRFPEGAWKLGSYYEGLTPKGTRCSESCWQSWKNKLEFWKMRYPSSITPYIALAEFYLDYASEARGSGWADKVTEKGWELFRSRTAMAKKVLNDSKKLSEKCPHCYYLMLRVALCEGWNREEYDTLFNEAVSNYPEYFDYYFIKAMYLLERWHGKKGEWQKFADESLEKTKQKMGYSMYARICWSLSCFLGEELFAKGNADWDKMKKGFMDIEKYFPNSSWNLNIFCRFACLAGDKKTAHELFGRIGEKPYFRAWDSEKEYNSWKSWAEK